MERSIVFGDRSIPVRLPDHAQVVPPGISVPLRPAPDLEDEIRSALEHPLDRPPLRDQVRPGQRVTIAFDDATVPCYAPVWPLALPLVVDELLRGGVKEQDIHLLCANALHRKMTTEELALLLGDETVRRHRDRLGCHDAEDSDALADLGATAGGHPVEVNRRVVDSDLTVYLNCSTTRGFSGGWKSICVGLSTYRSIRMHHTPDIMSMSLDRNRMHEMLDAMGSVVDERVGSDRIFKLETVLSNPLQIHTVYGGSVGATRAKVLETLRDAQPPRRTLVEEPVDIVVYGVPDWSPYAAFSHGNPILDLISTGLGYLGGVIPALGKPGCTVVLATPCPYRWDDARHPSYREVWETVLPRTKDPDEARATAEPELAARPDYIDRYRNGFGFHPVHAVMALYPLKRLRHAGRVVVAGAADPAVPRHCGFEHAATVEEAVAIGQEVHGRAASIALVDYPPAANRTF